MRRYGKKLSNRVVIVLSIVLCCVLIGLFVYTDKKDKEREVYLREIQANLAEVTDENSINLPATSGYEAHTFEAASLIFDNEYFLSNCKRTNNSGSDASVKLYNLKIQGGDKKIFLLNFKMRASENMATIKVYFGGNETFYAYTQWSDCWYICDEDTMNSIVWTLDSDFQIVELTDVYLYEFNLDDINIGDLPCGQYNLEGEYEELNENSSILDLDSGRDVVYSNGYVYILDEGTLYIGMSQTDGTLDIVSQIEGLGEVRHCELYNDNVLAVASRLNGVYLVDVSDKLNPTIISNWNTVEIANDICFVNDYMIVAGRYFGVEIVDISDLDHPEFVSMISTAKENYRVTTDGHYLFVSLWATGEVYIYDISSINKPNFVSKVSVNGRCGEAKVDGNMLYVVTGYHAMSNNTEIGSYGYGTGNGLTIFNISDITYPKKISTIKTDGSLYALDYDDWSVTISNSYVFFSSTYDGVYVYDISEPDNPRRVKKLTVALYKDVSKKWKDYKTYLPSYVFPYDSDQYVGSPVTGIAVADNMIYFVCYNTGVYSCPFEGVSAVYEGAKRADGIETVEVSYSNRYKNVEYVLQDKMVNAIQKYGDYYYVACGDGILTLNSTFDVVSVFQSKRPVLDLDIVDGWLYAAQTDGVGTYKINGSDIVFAGYFESQSKNSHVSSIVVTPDGNFAIAQTNFTSYELICLIDKYNPYKVETVKDVERSEVPVSNLTSTGSLYYRNLIASNDSGLVGIIGNSNSLWFRSCGGELYIERSFKNPLYREEGGTVAIPGTDDILTVSKYGYIVYNPLTVDESLLANANATKIESIYMQGKATLSDNILVVCHEANSKIWIVDVSDLEHPRLLQYLEVDGNPDLCLIEDERILIPSKHAGLIVVDIS